MSDIYLDLNVGIELEPKSEPMDTETAAPSIETPAAPVPQEQGQLSQPETLHSSEEVVKSEPGLHETAPKKRGRPPLNPTSTPSSAPTPEQKQPKKRGRPPKIREPELSLGSDSEGDQRKSSDALPNTSQEAPSSELGAPPAPVKRGRGRPRKGEVVIKPDPKIPKKRGRPPKSASAISEDDQTKKKLKNDDVRLKKKSEDNGKYKNDKQKLRQAKDWKIRPQSRTSNDRKPRTDSDPRFPHRINLSIGADQSTGPGFYSVTAIKCTLPPPDIQKAYQLGTEKLGFDFQKETCTSEANCSLSSEFFQKLVAAGVPVLDDDEEANDTAFELTLESYREIWLHVAKLGNPLLNWLVGDLEAMPIGGQGLFHDLTQKEVL